MPLGYLAIVFKVCFNLKRCENESKCLEKYLRQETEARNLGLYLVEGGPYRFTKCKQNINWKNYLFQHLNFYILLLVLDNVSAGLPR